MDEQIARQMFENIANEVVNYVKKPTSKKDLVSRIKKRVNFPENALVEENPNHKGVRADLSFYLDDSKKQKIKVHVSCSKVQEGVIGQGNVTAGRALYHCYPHLYE